MDFIKEQLKKFALEKGFDDLGFVRADDLAEKKDMKQPRTLMENAACIIVLFKAYRPADKAPRGYMALSAYYSASHAAYHAARAVADYIKQQGADALHTTAISAKGVALRMGGHIGDNGFYYHPVLGSFVCIQTVLTDICTPSGDGKSERHCLHCGACAAACPSHAVGDIQNCLRYHINGRIPEKLRKDVYQLLGCEKCQSACPLNERERSEPALFALEELLSGAATSGLRDMAGPNMARRARLISQAALYAAVTGQKQFIGRLEALAQAEEEPIRSSARWAVSTLNGENK